MLGDAAVENPGDDKNMRKFLAIEDPRTIPYLRQLVEKKGSSSRSYALQGLAKFDSDEALAGIEVCLTTTAAEMRPYATTGEIAQQSAYSIHHAAAVALRDSPHPRAQEKLLSLHGHPYRGVRITVLHRLGKLDTQQSLRLLEKMCKDENEMVRNEAIRYLRARQSQTQSDSPANLDE